MGRSVDEPVRLRARPRGGAHREPRVVELETAREPPAASERGAVAEGPRHPAPRAARLDNRELQRIAEHQERVLADVRASLEQFRQRSAKLAKDYVRVLARPLVTTLGPNRR
jgi:hypothetical protein